MLVARRKERLEELRAELLARHPALQVEIHTADLRRHNPRRFEALISSRGVTQKPPDRFAYQQRRARRPGSVCNR
jgi:hypothetical protein